MKRLLLLLAMLLWPCYLYGQTPQIITLTPDHIVQGSGDTTIQLFGRNLPNTFVLWNGVTHLTTTFFSSSVVTAVVPAAQLHTIKTFTVQIGTSNIVGFHVVIPLAVVTRYDPAQFVLPQDTPVTVTGYEFASNATILFDWNPLTTTFVSSTTLTGTVPANLITPNVHTVTVYNGVFAGGSITQVIPSTYSAGVISVSSTGSGNGGIIRDTLGVVTLATPYFTLTGTNAADFAVSGCSDGQVLQPSQFCQLVITFTPSGTGAETATLTIFSDATNSPQSIPLAGTGSSAKTIQSVPTSINFGNTATGTSPSASASIMAAFGSFALNTPFDTLSGSGDFSVSGGTCADGLTLPPTCTVNVTFAPSVAGSKSATLTINSAADNNPITIALSGVAQAPGASSVKVTWGASSSAGIAGYNVYRAVLGSSFGAALNGGTPVNALTYTDTTVVSGTTYVYGVTAVGMLPNWPTGSESAVLQTNAVTP